MSTSPSGAHGACVQNLPTDPKKWSEGVEVEVTAELSQLLEGIHNAQVREDRGVSLLLLQPNTRAAVGELLRARATQPEADSIRYWYRFEGGGPTHAWISAGRFAVLDTAAGPLRFGASHVADGLVEWNRLAALPGQLDARLAAATATAVRQIFAPDVRFARIRSSDRLLVPVLVFRDHNGTNPISLLDGSLLRQAMIALAAPGQDVRMFTGVHHLHEHPHLATAVARARRADSVHQMDLLGHFATRTQPYLDTAVLHEAMVRAADPLAAELLRGSAPEMASAFFTSSPSGNDTATKRRSEGVRVLPVYVLSLTDDSSETDTPLLLDREGLVAARPDSVVVLHSRAKTLRVPYFHDSRPVHVDPAALTRHVLAGLAQALAGISPPTVRYSAVHRREVADLTWANGLHPFGPFSNSSLLSPLLTDLVMRNCKSLTSSSVVSLTSLIPSPKDALSSVHQALEVARQKMEDVNAFARAYLYDPFGKELDNDEPRDWLDFLYHTPAAASARAPLSQRAVSRLHEEMERLVSSAKALAVQLSDSSEAQQLAAYRGAVGFGRLAEVFRQYVYENINTAERELLCCALQSSVASNRLQLNPEPPVTHRPLPLLLLAFLIVGAAGGYAYWRRQQLKGVYQRPRKRYSPTLY